MTYNHEINPDLLPSHPPPDSHCFGSDPSSFQVLFHQMTGSYISGDVYVDTTQKLTRIFRVETLVYAQFAHTAKAGSSTCWATTEQASWWKVSCCRCVTPSQTQEPGRASLPAQDLAPRASLSGECEACARLADVHCTAFPAVGAPGRPSRQRRWLVPAPEAGGPGGTPVTAKWPADHPGKHMAFLSAPTWLKI